MFVVAAVRIYESEEFFYYFARLRSVQIENNVVRSLKWDLDQMSVLRGLNDGRVVVRSLKWDLDQMSVLRELNVGRVHRVRTLHS